MTTHTPGRYLAAYAGIAAVFVIGAAAGFYHVTNPVPAASDAAPYAYPTTTPQGSSGRYGGDPTSPASPPATTPAGTVNAAPTRSTVPTITRAGYVQVAAQSAACARTPQSAPIIDVSGTQPTVIGAACIASNEADSLDSAMGMGYDKAHPVAPATEAHTLYVPVLICESQCTTSRVPVGSALRPTLARIATTPGEVKVGAWLRQCGDPANFHQGATFSAQCGRWNW